MLGMLADGATLLDLNQGWFQLLTNPQSCWNSALQVCKPDTFGMCHCFSSRALVSDGTIQHTGRICPAYWIGTSEPCIWRSAGNV